MKHMLLCVGVALGVSLSSTISGHAFSIGEMKVQSHLHTPFVADVPLIMKPYERAQGVVAVIGDAHDYEAEGVTRLPVIEVLHPRIITGLSAVIRIISTEPIEVEAFDLLLLVRAGKVTIVQNYPVALTPDPRSAPIVAATAPPAKAMPSVPAPQATSETPSAASPAAAAWLANLPSQYGPILRGDMLYKVMVRLGVPEPYIWQVAVRIWAHNQDRFIRGNLHGLQIGAELDIPENLGNSLPKLSQDEALQIVAEQWDRWQRPGPMAVASASAQAAGIGNAAETAPAKPVAQPSESVAFAPHADTSSPVNMAMLESMLQGFEQRLAQRLSLPNPPAEAADDHAITFVSTDDLQTAIQGLEARLIRQLETGQPLTGAWPSDTGSQQSLLRVDMDTALASFFSADSLVYVLIVQNVLLLVIAAGVAWRWYRKRA